jgi:hypothetical protein
VKRIDNFPISNVLSIAALIVIAVILYYLPALPR